VEIGTMNAERKKKYLPDLLLSDLGRLAAAVKLVITDDDESWLIEHEVFPCSVALAINDRSVLSYIAKYPMEFFSGGVQGPNHDVMMETEEDTNETIKSFIGPMVKIAIMDTIVHDGGFLFVDKGFEGLSVDNKERFISIISKLCVFGDREGVFEYILHNLKGEESNSFDGYSRVTVGLAIDNYETNKDPDVSMIDFLQTVWKCSIFTQDWGPNDDGKYDMIVLSDIALDYFKKQSKDEDITYTNFPAKLVYMNHPRIARAVAKEGGGYTLLRPVSRPL
jgi:hypothetical protein